MPIRGITTRPVNNIGNNLPIIARLYKGAKRTQEHIDKKQPAPELPYFRVEFEPEYARFAPAFIEMFGEKPDALTGLYIGADDTTTAFTAFYREWGKIGLIRECDGDFITRSYDPEEGRITRPVNVPCKLANNGTCGCKQEGNLNFIIPAFSELVGVLGVFRITTHSNEDIRAIYQVLMVTQMIYGKLFGVPFILSRKLEEIGYFDKKEKKRKTTRKYFVKLRVDDEFVRLGIANRLGAGNHSAHQLPAGDGRESAVIISASPPRQTWLGTNGNTDKLLTWAKGWFKMLPHEVLEALQSDAPTIQTLQAYTGDRSRVYASVIAWACNGDTERIAPICATKGCVPEDIAPQ
ncbi:MAG TPA: hypothetical protein PLZ51_08025, partial [Aggregatilineales bacterium]|nr:hypothetical protein [Aggregatilineales bacterium]